MTVNPWGQKQVGWGVTGVGANGVGVFGVTWVGADGVGVFGGAGWGSRWW